MKHIFVLFLFLVLETGINAQRISSGFTATTPLAGSIHFNQNYYNPVNTVRIYFVHEPGADQSRMTFFSPMGLGMKWYKTFGLGVGYQMKAEFNRYILRLGYQFIYNSATVRLNHFGYSGEVDNYKALFNMQNLQHRIPLTFSINLKNHASSPMIVVGAEYGQIVYMKERIDWDPGHYDRYYIPFMYGKYYDNNPWITANIGYGKKHKNIEWYLLWKTRVDKHKSDLSMQNQQMEFTFAWYLSYKSLRRKHFIYYEE
ncbi:MAG: hypothetical protein K1X56_03565 [Flavobacteriales bacterium]|nr:hypothetical protein [Flavobacteriales bacterium]